MKPSNGNPWRLVLVAVALSAMVVTLWWATIVGQAATTSALEGEINCDELVATLFADLWKG